MKTAEINFPVQKVENPLITMGYDCVDQESQALIGTINGNSKILHHCSEDYKLVTNAEIFGGLERLFSSYAKTADYQVSVVNIEDVMFAVTFKFPQFMKKIRKVDEIIAGFTVRNSYNGKWSFAGYLNVWRQICSNGLWGTASVLSVKHKHTENVQTVVQQMFLEVVNKLEAFDGELAKYEVLAEAERQFGWEDRLEEVAKSSGMPKFHDEAKAIARAEANELYGGVVNDFVIYNALNNVLFDDSFNKKHQDVRAKIDEKIFETLSAS